MVRQDRRAQIMKAVEKLFTSRRVHEVTLDDVAHEANVGKGTIYRYFKDKDDLFFHTAISGFDHLCELLKQNVREDATFEQQLLVACREIRDFHRRHRPLFRMMRSEDARMSLSKGTLSKTWIQHRKKLAAAVAEILRRGIGEGRMRMDVSVEILAGYLLGMLRAHGRDRCNQDESTDSFRQVVEVFLNGAGPSDKTASVNWSRAMSYEGR
ncbi:MAG: TetR/AcrR family transcriptional regulator [Phycisphaerae bacterium]|nr:TetR/AcrR family transcriptional regulator [Phycisphaerae bacterium]